MQDQILELSRKHKLSHIGSCLSVLPILEEIYRKKQVGDKVILDGAHAHLAHLVVSFHFAHKGDEDTYDPNWPEHMLESYGIHCDRRAGCDASGGSLGHGAGIAIGYALANPESTIYLIVTDGSVHEGSFWESLLTIKRLGIKNIELYTNFNGYTALDAVDPEYLENCIKTFGIKGNCSRTNNGLPELEGLKGHYQVLE